MRRPSSRRLARPGVFLAVAMLALLPVAGAEEEDAASRSGCTQLAFEGKAVMSEDPGSLGQQEFRFDLTVANQTEGPIEIEAANLMLGHEGGWLTPLDPEAVDGSFFHGPLRIEANERRPIASQDYVSETPATHALLFATAQDGHCAIAVPIERDPFQTPVDVKPPYPFGVGIVAPLHALPYSDGSLGILLVGQHQVLDGTEPADVETEIVVSSDAGMSQPLKWKGFDAEGDLVALWPFARRIGVHEQFQTGRLRIDAKAFFDPESDDADAEQRTETFTGSWPVKRVDPAALRAPVTGTWQLSSGPGMEVFTDNYASPQFRYAYDLVVLNQAGRTHKGDPHINTSYFAWGRDVLAAADGVVVAYCQTQPDNPGYRGAQSKQCHVNHVVLKHEGEVYTAYLHLKQSSLPQGLIKGTRVRAGQLIARVGNSGDSSEPHLHFMAFTINQVGRVESLPVRFSNAQHVAKNGKPVPGRPVEGVPVGGHRYHFLGR